MYTILSKKIPFYIFLLIGIHANAQVKLNPERKASDDKLNITIPKSFYFEPSIKDFSLLNNLKSTLKLSPHTTFKSAPSRAPFSNTLLFDLNAMRSSSQESTIDNMVCVLPGKQIKFHITVVDPTTAKDYYADNMPNALPGQKLIK